MYQSLSSTHIAESAHRCPWGLSPGITCDSGFHAWCEVHVGTDIGLCPGLPVPNRVTLGKSLPFLSLLSYLKSGWQAIKVLFISRCPRRPYHSSWGTGSTIVNPSPPCPPPPHSCQEPQKVGLEPGLLVATCWREGRHTCASTPTPASGTAGSTPGHMSGWDGHGPGWGEGLPASVSQGHYLLHPHGPAPVNHSVRCA